MIGGQRGAYARPRRGRRAAAAGLLLAAFAATPGHAAEPGAFELLAAAKKAYAGLTVYRDGGTVEEIGADGTATTIARFETEAQPAAGGARRFRFALLDAERVAAAVWNVDGEAFAYDGASGLYAPLGAAGPVGVRRLLPEVYDALAVPALLAGDGAALDFEAASFDGAEACPVGRGDRCFAVSAIRMSGALEVRLWIEVESHLVRRVELTVYPPAEILGRAAAEAGLPAVPAVATGAGALPRIVRVSHRVLLATGPADTPAAEFLDGLFAPPEGARRVALADLPAPPPRARPVAGTAPGEPQATFSERIEVRRIEIEVRALDPAGEPIVGLGKGDFRVTLDGEEAAVEAVDWLPTGQDAFAAGGAGAGWAELARAGVTVPAVPAPGRLTVVFVQADMEPSRVTGHLRMLRQLDLLFADLQPDDRMAVVSFDSHLKLRQDFTGDRGRLASAIEEAATSFGGEAWAGRQQRFPSLGRHLDADEAKRAATPERALELTGRALARLPGPKSILFLGWGLGRFDARSGTVAPAPGYEEARLVLAGAGIPVFVLDVSDSAAHSLELGLQQVAEDTGGRYERMAFFPAQAAKRIVRMMGDRYVVVFVRPAGLPAGEHRLTVELVGRRGTVLAPRTVTDPARR